MSNSYLRFLSATLLGACAIWPAAPALSVIPPINEDSAKDANYTCTPVADDVARATAARLAVHTYSKNDLACATDMRRALANAAPGDLALHVEALQSLLAYLDHIRTLHAFDLGHINTGEFDARLEHARKVATELVPRARAAWPDDPRITTLTAIVDLYASQEANHLDTVRTAQKSLEKAIAVDPAVLDGLPHLALGRLQMELPPLLGGDTSRALAHFNSALQVAPTNVQALNAVAECDLQLGKPAEAVAMLRKVAALTPKSEADRQLFVDEWRTGEGLATRAGDEALAGQMGKLRSNLLKQHQELLPRNSSIVLGHGGSNPVTGSPQYEGDHTQPTATDTKHKP